MNSLDEKLNKIELRKRRILANYKKERHLKLLKRSEGRFLIICYSLLIFEKYVLNEKLVNKMLESYI